MKLLDLARRINHWSGLLQVALGVVGLAAGIALGVWGIKAGQQIALRSGSFDRPQLALYLGDERLEPGKPAVVLLTAPFAAKTVTIFDLPLRVVNLGNKSARDVALIIRFPELVRTGIAEVAERTVQRFNPAMLMNHSEAKLGHFDYQSFSFSAINPRSAAAVEEPFALSKETLLTFPVPLSHRNTAAVSVEYGFVVDITVAQADSQPLEYKLHLTARRAEDDAELKSVIAHYIHSRILKRRRELPWHQYLAAIAGQSSEELFIAPTTVRVTTPVADGAVVQATSFATSIARLEYKPTAIRLLFRKPAG